MSGADAWTVADPTVCLVCQRDACNDPAHLPPRDDEPRRPAPRSQLSAVRALDVITAPLPAEIIEGVASVGRVTVLPSESGAGKTFVLLDLAAAVSDDVAWHGRATRHGSVVYASYEGDALGLRLRALRDTVKRRLEHLYIIRAADPLSPLTRDGELPSLGEGALTLALATLQAELASAHRPPLVLLIIDTVRASLAGSEIPASTSPPICAPCDASWQPYRAPGASWLITPGGKTGSRKKARAGLERMAREL